MRTVDPDRHAARRGAIMAAAARCFSEKGFHRTSTADICAAAGISSGNLFHYFPSKQAIIVAIVDREAEEVVALFAGLREMEPLDGLSRFLDLILDLAADRAYVRLALEISAEASRDPAVAARVARGDGILQGALRDLLADAAASGAIDSTLDPAAAAVWIGAVVDGLFNRVSLDPAFRPQDQGAMVHRLVMRFLAPAAGTVAP